MSKPLSRTTPMWYGGPASVVRCGTVGQLQWSDVVRWANFSGPMWYGGPASVVRCGTVGQLQWSDVVRWASFSCPMSVYRFVISRALAVRIAEWDRGVDSGSRPEQTTPGRTPALLAAIDDRRD
ncbi:hypothetical protein LSAT2_009675 [Lamellibrachia satsuma]|nr:hypothetical protein LSAT2_009675 [Lamellibrachia satsuma]